MSVYKEKVSLSLICTLDLQPFHLYLDSENCDDNLHGLQLLSDKTIQWPKFIHGVQSTPDFGELAN